MNGVDTAAFEAAGRVAAPGDLQSAYAQSKRLPQVSGKMDPRKAHKVAVDFEAMMLGQMLQPMFKELNTDPPFGGGPGEEMWRSMMVDEYGRAIAKSGGIGIAPQVFNQIMRMQEERSGGTATPHP